MFLSTFSDISVAAWIMAATAVFLMETGMVMGLRFNEVYSVGNSAQIGVEDVLEHMDETFDPKDSSKIKLLSVSELAFPFLAMKLKSSVGFKK